MPLALRLAAGMRQLDPGSAHPLCLPVKNGLCLQNQYIRIRRMVNRRTTSSPRGYGFV